MVLMTTEQKVFEEFPQANCNTCRSYMLDQCDGVPVGESRKCTAYEATRQSDLPMQIEKLNDEIKTIRLNLILQALVILLLGVGHLV